MKIKEVEKQIGITRANIRYYEKEGLLMPLRNQENNYREYTKEDVERLERIKILRTLGISIAEIKQLNKGTIQLADAVENRLTQIHEEEQKLLEICQVCEFILQNNISFEEVNDQLLNSSTKTSNNWKNDLTGIWQEDTDRRFYGRDILYAVDFVINLALVLVIIMYYRHIYLTVGAAASAYEIIFAGVGIPLVGCTVSCLTAVIELIYGISRIQGKKPYSSMILQQWPMMWVIIKCMMLCMGIAAWFAGINIVYL